MHEKTGSNIAQKAQRCAWDFCSERTYVGHDKAALLHLLAHVRGQHGRRQGAALALLDLAGERVPKAHALPQAHLAVGVIRRACKWARGGCTQLLLRLLPLPDLLTASTFPLLHWQLMGLI